MSGREHRELREMLGAFVLGGLTAAEEVEVREHLATCRDCRAELDLISPVGHQLALLAPGSTGPAESVPEHLGARVADAVANARRARSRGQVARLALVAASAAVIAAATTVAVVELREPGAAPLEAVAVSAADPGVVADANLVNHTWGVEIKLSASGLAAGTTYQVSILTQDGGRRSAGEFVGVGDAAMLCNLSTSVLRPDAVGFVVVDDTGAAVIESAFPG